MSSSEVFELNNLSTRISKPRGMGGLTSQTHIQTLLEISLGEIKNTNQTPSFISFGILSYFRRSRHFITLSPKFQTNNKKKKVQILVISRALDARTSDLYHAQK